MLEMSLTETQCFQEMVNHFAMHDFSSPGADAHVGEVRETYGDWINLRSGSSQILPQLQRDCDHKTMVLLSGCLIWLSALPFYLRYSFCTVRV